MNNRFKFRVWSYKQKRMINSWDYSSKRDFLYGALIDHRFFGNGLFITMQCTGLKDKNGKLIYEGDILEVQYIGGQIPLFKNKFSDQPENERFEIIYDESSHQYRCVNDFYRNTCEIHSLDFYKIQINTENKLYEVIGNIYESPELLYSLKD